MLPRSVSTLGGTFENSHNDAWPNALIRNTPTISAMMFKENHGSMRDTAKTY